MTGTAICILGMHRSGTSALTGTLSILGVRLGSNLLPAAESNAAGFWEHAEIVAFHDRLLAHLGSAWDDVRPLPADWWRGAEMADARAELCAILRGDLAIARVWAVKDPRLCRLLPLWLEVLDEIGARPCFVHIQRHPGEVAASLAERDGFGREKSALLWLEHTLSAEFWTRGRTRLFVGYDSLLAQPRAVLERIGRVLSLAWPMPLETAGPGIQAFLSPRLRHHADGAEGDFGAYAALVSRLCPALGAAERGETPELRATFDAVRAEHAKLIATFDPALCGHVEDLHARVHALEAEIARIQASWPWRLRAELRVPRQLLDGPKRLLARLGPGSLR